MKTLLFVIALCTLVYAQEPKQPPPNIDSVTVDWNENAITGHTATLRWSEQLPEPAGITVNKYRVWRSRTSGGLFKVKSSTSGGATTYVDNTVVSGKTYWYYVTALATNGIESGPSSSVAVTIP